MAAITKPLAPPGKVLTLPVSDGFLENCQIKMPSRICAARKETPASIMVSDICSSMSPPCVEMSAGGSQVCKTKGTAEAIAMMIMVTANSLPIVPRVRPQLLAGNQITESMTSCRAMAHNKRTKNLVGFRGENKTDGLGFAAANDHVLSFLAVGFVVSGNRVFARRKIGKLETAIFAGNGVVRVLEHGERAVHPRVNVALHGNHLRLVVLIDDGRRAGRLRFVPLPVNFRERVNVVRSLIVVGDF